MTYTSYLFIEQVANIFYSSLNKGNKFLFLAQAIKD